MAEQIDSVNALVAAVLAAMVAIAGWRFKALSVSGACVAWGVGTMTVVGAGWLAGFLMAAFFASSSLLSRVGHSGIVGGLSKRGSRRDAVQVLANGGIVALLALGGLLYVGFSPIFTAGIAGALAAATADTWATEIGRRARGQPRKITTGDLVAPGVSGGVTPLGTAASLAGAVFIASLALILAPVPGEDSRFIASAAGFTAITLAGFGGALADSIAGATVQALYVCDSCRTATERSVHTCGQPATLVAGNSRVTNDVVNLIATLTGAAIAVVLAILVS